MNEPLRQALLRARLREDDVAARLGVDPKTVRRWLNGRVPYPHNRVAIAELVGADEGELWPEAGGPLAARSRPEELGTVYPHRWAVPREVWSGGPGESHPRAPTDPCVTVSRYTALVVLVLWRAGFTQAQCAKYRGRFPAASAMARMAFLQDRSFLYFFMDHRSR